MASLFKPTYTKLNRDTREKEKKKSRKWHVKYRDGGGVVRRVPGFTDKEATRQLAAKLQRGAELTRVGISDPFEAHRRRPLIDHLSDFENHLRDKGTSEGLDKLVSGRARKVAAACEFHFIADLSASRVEAFLADLRRSGASIQTSNFYLQAIKQFARWLVRDRRAGDSSLAHLSGGNVDLDRRHDRRALSTDEFASLLTATRRGGTFRELAGEERAMLYLVAAYTGLRASELASLTPASFNLALDSPSVSVEAAYSKHRRRDLLPLHPGLVGPIKEWVNEKPNRGRLWPGKWAEQKQGGVMLKRDLMVAGITYRDAEGRHADFHSLRHTYITNLVRSGVPPKVAQSLARHSTITLTMDRYAHVDLADQAAAIRNLPAVPAANQEAETDQIESVRTGSAEPRNLSSGLYPLSPELVPCRRLQLSSAGIDRPRARA